MEDVNTRYYIRFSLAQRFLHGALAATFLGLAFTGLPLRFSTYPYMQSMARLVGGFGTVLFFHKFCAVSLTLAFGIHVANLVYKIVVKKEYFLLWGPRSMVPRLKDIQDFFGNFMWFLHLGPKPKFDRFAYWDKVDYWAVFWGMGIIGLSGYAMWFGSFFARFVPGSWLNIALLIHGEEAILAVGFIFTIHFFNTHLRPGSFPMDLVIFTGKETEKELREKHSQEYQRLLKEGRLELTEVAPSREFKYFSRTVGWVIILVGFVLLVLTLNSFFRISGT